MGLRRTSALAAACLLLAACGAEQSSTDEPSEAPATSTTASERPAPQSPGSTAPTVSEHAVEAPGPLKERLWSADILIVAEEPLSDETIEQISRVKGVAHVEVIGLAQAPVENRVVNVAAVNPATYRQFMPVDSAQFQDMWDRVAGGELAIDQRLGKRLANKQGYVTLGAGDDAPELHVGAFGPQVPVIEAVVNTTWTDQLQMQFGNAVLLSTDSAAPAVVRPRLAKIVGKDASIQALDIAARLGLDPKAQQVVVPTGGTLGDVVGTFTYRVQPGGLVAPDAGWVSSHIETRTMPIIGEMTCNKAIFPQLEAALEEIQGAGLADKIDPSQYAGCYYPRFIANTTTLSNHAFGTAFDINTAGNQRGTVGEIDRGVVAIFERWGFTWGGRWSWTDPMHFEMSRVVEPG